MLKKVEIKNFKSFKNQTEINLSKTNYNFLSQNVNKDGILKGCIFVGPNASGKSSKNAFSGSFAVARTSRNFIVDR